MPEFFAEHPGRLYVVATLLPLFPAALILLVGTVRNLARVSLLPDAVMGRLSIICLCGSATLALFGLAWRYHEIFPWQEQFEWLRFGSSSANTGLVIPVGYYIDTITALMFAMVTVIAVLIFVFAQGYLADELKNEVEDHEAHVQRRGRYSRFYLYLNLFVFSMQNLLLADNLFQVFVSWELVGVCSFFLIGFYYERFSAGWAANKAFIVNRIGDAGFLVGIAVAWSVFGTLDISEMIKQFRYLPSSWTWDQTGAHWDSSQFWHSDPYSPAMLTLMGLGLFLGCVGKSAQFPLQVWLPDAMAGPTPVSALIHAATMVAAGVYLVARCYALLTPEVLLVIAYTGCITLFLAATVACVQTDIKKVLAYSTVSQLGYMMLALGVGGGAAGVFHLLTHAFFKALLFLGAGSVIYGLHHEQDLRRMGGLHRKMPLTSLTMLVGVLAISGVPFLSGWYSKEAILTAAANFGLGAPSHSALAVIPFLTAGLTAFYMFRLWFLIFTGEPRDRHTYDHAHESPRVMTVPLIVLAMFSIGVGWGWPVWETDKSVLFEWIKVGNFRSLHHAYWFDDTLSFVRYRISHEYHLILEVGAGAIGLLGFAVAYWLYFHRTPTFAPNSGHSRSRLAGFFASGWYFDAVYDAVIRKPTQRLATVAAAADKQPIDSATPRSLDGVFNGIGRLANASGRGLRSLQTGRVRGYVAILGLTVVGVLGMLAVLTR